MRKYLIGDFFALAGGSISDREWSASQFQTNVVNNNPNPCNNRKEKRMNLITKAMSGAVLVALSLTLGIAADAGTTEKVATDTKNAWTDKHLANNRSSLPFSFTYDGEPSTKLLSEWPAKAANERLDAQRTRRTITWTDPKTGLEVRCVAVDYADYPAVEWTVWFKNTGKADAPILKDIQGLDATFTRPAQGEFVLHGNKGDWNVAEGFEPHRRTLAPGATQRFAPNGGRPTNGPNGWPYYNVQWSGGGVMLAIGWPGQWAASFSRDEKTALRITAGQELTHLSLKPGEEIRSPLTALLFWQGDDVVPAQNLWRRWFMTHNIPKIDGKPPAPMAQMQLAPTCKAANRNSSPK